MAEGTGQVSIRVSKFIKPSTEGVEVLITVLCVSGGIHDVV